MVAPVELAKLSIAPVVPLNLASTYRLPPATLPLISSIVSLRVSNVPVNVPEKSAPFANLTVFDDTVLLNTVSPLTKLVTPLPVIFAPVLKITPFNRFTMPVLFNVAVVSNVSASNEAVPLLATTAEYVVGSEYSTPALLIFVAIVESKIVRTPPLLFSIVPAPAKLASSIVKLDVSPTVKFASKDT